MTRASDSGVSLLNVLVVVAAASGLVQVMLAGQQGAVSDVTRTHDIAQADALARGGVASVAVALRRDMIDAPEADHLHEDWAKAAQEAVTFEFGRFEVEIRDARGKFNLNALAAGAFLEQRTFAALLAALDLPDAIAVQITSSVQDQGPLRDPTELTQRGLAKADVERLLPHVETLDTAGPINLNTASAPLLSAVFANPAAAQALVARRAATGRLTQDDLRAVGLLLPASAGFTSDTFDVQTSARVGVAHRVLKRRILRDPEAGTLTILATD